MPPSACRTSVAAALLLAFISASPAATSPADPYPDSTAKALEEWRDWRYGMFIHWGPVSLKGTEISWSRGTQVPRAEYDTLYKRFDPTGFNAKEWVDLAVAGGMRYITLTTKHHDGFCLWDTKYTDYNIMRSPFARDVTKELAAECKRQGIRFCAYYSVTDWYQPDWGPNTHGGPGYDLPAGQSPDVNRYALYLKNQVGELVREFDPAVIWFDHADYGPWTAALGQQTYTALKTLKPGLLMDNRLNFPGDFYTPEKKIGQFDTLGAWETCNTIANQWSYKPNNPLRPDKNYVSDLVQVIGAGGNYLLNLGPGPDGRFVPAEAAKLRMLGTWVKAHAAGIYGTRGGPFLPGTWGAATHKGDTVYVHVLQWPAGDSLVLPSLPKPIRSYRRLTGGSVNLAQTATGLVLKVPAAGRDTLGETIEIVTGAAVAIRGAAMAASGPSLAARGGQVTYTLPRAARVEVGLWDSRGRRLAVLDAGMRAAGAYSAEWRSHARGPGAYWVRLSAGGSRVAARVVVGNPGG